MKIRLRVSFVALSILLAAPVLAADEPAPSPSAEAAQGGAAKAPAAEQSVTEHRLAVGGRTVAYRATAGTLILRNDADEPIASVGYFAYVENGASAGRPITFAFNGGPGSSSIWLHMGALGPRRIVTTDAAATPPAPYRMVDNAESLLDVTDLVMIDPVGTGFSKAVGKSADKDFWGVDPDIDEVSRFIVQYVTDNGRWNSPKFLLGESYGTTRGAGIVDLLQQKWNLALNGVVLVSTAIDLESIFEWTGNERPYPLFVPTFAATAWYHHVLPAEHPDLQAFLDEVSAWALGPYNDALMQGDRLSAADRAAVLAKLHEYTGLATDYIDRANLRVTEGEFTHELMLEHRQTVGRLDSRFLGVSFDPMAKEAESDPQSDAISSAFTAAFQSYLRDELKFGAGHTYKVGNDEIFKNWNFTHKAPGMPFPMPMVNTGPDLAHALGANPHLRVLVLQGTFDLATPFAATEYTFAHLGLTPEQRARIQTTYFPAGHMMYVEPGSLPKFKSAIADFVKTATHP
jgi:carboxypeptidase C (cathepsin A)